MTQGNLFENPGEPIGVVTSLTETDQGIEYEITRHDEPTAGRHHRGARKTEVRAAINGAPKFGTQRHKVLQALVDAEIVGGLARWEIVNHVPGILLSSVCGRLSELEVAGFIERTGKERKQQTGQNGEIFRATARGRRAIISSRAKQEGASP